MKGFNVCVCYMCFCILPRLQEFRVTVLNLSCTTLALPGDFLQIAIRPYPVLSSQIIMGKEFYQKYFFKVLQMSLMSTQGRKQLDRRIKTVFVHFLHSTQGQLHLSAH